MQVVSFVYVLDVYADVCKSRYRRKRIAVSRRSRCAAADKPVSAQADLAGCAANN